MRRCYSCNRLELDLEFHAPLGVIEKSNILNRACFQELRSSGTQSTTERSTMGSVGAIYPLTDLHLGGERVGAL